MFRLRTVGVKDAGREVSTAPAPKVRVEETEPGEERKSTRQ
jgi:hypothetical protein